MRCLHLTLSTAQGGRRDAIVTLITHLRPLGVRCGLVGLRDTAVQVATLQPLLEFYDGFTVDGRPTPKAMLRLWRLCREHQIEVIHAHDAGSQVVASLLRCVLPGLHIVMTFHRTLGLDSEGWRNRLRNRLTLPLVSKVITASEERRSYFLRTTPYPADSLAVVPHGVNQEIFCPDPTSRGRMRALLGAEASESLLLAVGHFGPEKGLDLAIAAVAEAVRIGGKRVRFVILGTGTAEREAVLRAHAEALLPGQVSFLGYRSDVAEWMQAADLLVHAPRLEAFGMVTVQAMSCGIPVVATAVGGLPEIVVDGETGSLTPAGDSRAMGVRIAEYLADDPGRQRAGEAAKALVQARFDAAGCARRHLAIYREVTQ